MNTDYLMMISGVLGGNGGCSSCWSSATRSAAVDELGRFSETPAVDLSRPAG